MSLRIRQIVLATRDLGAAVDRLERLLRVAVCYRDPLVAKFGLQNALLPVGDQFLEVIAPVQPDTAAERHLARHGDSAYMLILQSDDLDRDRARLARLAIRIIWQADFPDMRACQIHPKDIGAAIVSLDQPSPPESWRWAGNSWHNHRHNQGQPESPRNPARGHRIVAARIGAVDPQAMAARWAEVLGTEAPTGRPDGQRLKIDTGALHFAPADADLITGFDLAVPDVAAALETARDLGLPIHDGASVGVCGTHLRLRPS